MERYEVTMQDGWKTRISAESPEAAKAKVEKMNRHGLLAINVVECADMDYRDYVHGDALEHAHNAEAFNDFPDGSF